MWTSASVFNCYLHPVIPCTFPRELLSMLLTGHSPLQLHMSIYGHLLTNKHVDKDMRTPYLTKWAISCHDWWQFRLLVISAAKMYHHWWSSSHLVQLPLSVPDEVTISGGGAIFSQPGGQVLLDLTHVDLGQWVQTSWGQLKSISVKYHLLATQPSVYALTTPRRARGGWKIAIITTWAGRIFRCVLSKTTGLTCVFIN